MRTCYFAAHYRLAGYVGWNVIAILLAISYLIDDDIAAAANDPTLPAAYRQRMGHIVHLQPRLLMLSDEVVACSEQLAQLFVAQHGHVSVLTPPLIASLPNLEHFRLTALSAGAVEDWFSRYACPSYGSAVYSACINGGSTGQVRYPT